jgi:diguanylate cyclase (GGDEF)-like protein
MGIFGRIRSMLITLCIINAYAMYYLLVDGHIGIEVWFAYPLTIPIAYWKGLQYDKAKYYAEKDPLTGLYNRRFVLDMYDKIIALSKRNQTKMYVMVLDCNNFKFINDQYGHKTGDDVLKAIGNVLATKLRYSDVATRWGGDEFMVVGEYKDPEGMDIMVSRIKEELVLLSNSMKIPISASIGTAVCPDDHVSLQDLLHVADQKMYHDKNARNKPDIEPEFPLRHDVILA